MQTQKIAVIFNVCNRVLDVFFISQNALVSAAMFLKTSTVPTSLTVWGCPAVWISSSLSTDFL